MPLPSLLTAADQRSHVRVQLQFVWRDERELCFAPVRNDGNPPFSENFDFAGCVNITHRAPNQFSYRFGRKVAPEDERF